MRNGAHLAVEASPAAGRRRRRARRRSAARGRSTRPTASATKTFAIEVSCRACAAAVQHPRGVPDHQPRRVHLDRRVGEHRLHHLVLAQASCRTSRARWRSPPRSPARAARRPASACSGSAAPAPAAPARSSKPSPTSPSTASSADDASRTPPRSGRRRKPASSDGMWRTIRTPGCPASTRNIVAPAAAGRSASEVRAMQIVKAAPSAPVMNHLSPLITQRSPRALGAVRSIVRVGARAGRRLGHREARPDRALGERPQVRSFCSRGRRPAPAGACCPRRARRS